MAMDPNKVKDTWMNCFRCFAEGVVVMVSPVLLAIALTKVNLTQKEHGHRLPISMLVVAATTLIVGVCPSILGSFPIFWRSNDLIVDPPPPWPRAVTSTPLTFISSMFLLGLAWWIMTLLIDTPNFWAAYLPSVCATMIVCAVVRLVVWYRDHDDQQGGDAVYETVGKSLERLKKSLELSSGITALLFVGLETLALEGQISSNKKGAQGRLTTPMAASFFFCASGTALMFFETVPPRSNRSTRMVLAWFSDIVMSVGFASVTLVMFCAFANKPGLIVYGTINGGFLVIVIAKVVIVVAKGAVNNQQQASPPEPASLELTKVTFVGFLAVSIPSISNGSVHWSTTGFVILAAATIISGLVWRLLTHLDLEEVEKFKEVVKFASIFTYACVVTATVPFAIMAGKALYAPAPAPAPAPCNSI